MKHRVDLWTIGAVALALTIAIWLIPSSPTTAATSDYVLRDTLNDVIAGDIPVTIQFTQPVGRLGMSVDLYDEANDSELRLERVGIDGICITAPNSNNTQVDCVPYTVVAGISYTIR